MKIAIIRKRFLLSGGGGAEKYGSMVAHELVRRGHQVTIFSEEFSGETSKSLHWVKVPCMDLFSLCPAMRFHKAVQAVLDRKAFDVVYALCRTYPCDVVRVTEQVHSIWMPMHYSPLARFNPRHRGILKLERKTYSPLNTGWIVTNSELLKSQIVEAYNFPADRIHMIRNGLDRKVFSPPNGAERHSFRERLKLRDEFTMLFAAANFKIKGLEQALRVFAGLEPSLKARSVLLVVGGDSAAKWARLASRLGLGDKVHFLGERKMMREFYAASDLLLYPSMYETFSNVCLESLACGLPVLTTAMTGAAELVKEGSNGYVVKDHLQVKEMIRIVDAYGAMDHHARSIMSQAAIDSTSGLTWERHAQELVPLLEKAAQSRHV